ncbi:ZN574 protein, partial [Hypocryptadius cinnamomeus]|nr:ZN574 protein [Hypocryptadius cinnamomeus]
EETLLLVEHRYVCSECSHLSPSLEEALLHHQQHLQPPFPAPPGPQTHLPAQVSPQPHLELLGAELDPPSQFQCLECGALLLTPGQLLEHQELHLKLLGTPGDPPKPSPNSSGIHFECPECRALFQSQELWLAHRQSHRNAQNAPQTARVDVEHSYRKHEQENAEIRAEAGAEPPANDGAAVQLLLYECGECLQLFQSPKDFLEHQATHLA